MPGGLSVMIIIARKDWLSGGVGGGQHRKARAFLMQAGQPSSLYMCVHVRTIGDGCIFGGLPASKSI